MVVKACLGLGLGLGLTERGWRMHQWMRLSSDGIEYATDGAQCVTASEAFAPLGSQRGTALSPSGRRVSGAARRDFWAIGLAGLSKRGLSQSRLFEIRDSIFFQQPTTRLETQPCPLPRIPSLSQSLKSPESPR